MRFLIATGSAASSLLGLACLFAAYFLTEPEESHAQATLEKWWIVLDDSGSAFRKRLTRLAAVSGELTVRAIDAAFGPRTLSLRAAWSAAAFRWRACSMPPPPQK